MSHYLGTSRFYDSFNEAYKDMIQTIVHNGDIVHPRPDSSLGGTKEILNAGFAIPANMPLCTWKERKLCYAFAMLEPFYLFTTQSETDVATAHIKYAPNLVKLAYNEQTKEFDGNYGDRIHLRNPPLEDQVVFDNGEIECQIKRCYNVLRKDPDSRRALLTIHNPVWDVVNGNSKDIPCTLNLQFLIRDGKLHCFGQMRSNDIWYGTPHNVMMFTFLQRAMAAALHVPVGWYIHRANSLHIYDKHIEKAKKLLDSNEHVDHKDPQIDYPYGECKSLEDVYEDAMMLISAEKELRDGGGFPQGDFHSFPLQTLVEATKFLSRK
jgi:thymidylate synthase|tara:strand:- start:11858 stop:12823 length:966 start_codon:yes stop_codon:yes gene_type:complete